MSSRLVAGGPAPLLEAVEVVRDRLAVGGVVLVALDFDGTLTEIVDDPEDPALIA